MGNTNYMAIPFTQPSSSGESQIIPIEEKNRFLPYTSMFQWVRTSYWQAGVDNFSQPPGQQDDMFELLTNVQPVMQGPLQRRWGYTLFYNPTQTFRHLYSYQNDVAATRYLVGTNTATVQAFTEAGATYTTIFTPGAGAGNPRMVSSRSFGYFVDGLETDLKKWDGSTNAPTSWGIAAPATALSVGTPVSGAITLTLGRNYFVVYRNDNTSHASDLSPVSASTGPLTAQNVPLSNIPVSPDPQVTDKLILATLDGGDQTTLYQLADIPNSQTSLTDNIPDTELSQNLVWQETDSSGALHGVFGNDPPPNGTVPTKHLGRLYMIDGELLYYSKNISDLTTSSGTVCGKYEEAWPPTNYLDISGQAELGRALLSNGQTLYIGTERHVRQLAGDPSQITESPEVIFNETGVLNQEVWQAVYVEGQPVGCMWLTPDFRVIASDFNTYKDVGTPVQGILNTVNVAQAEAKANATFVSQGAFDFYLLAVPTGANTECDTLLVYNLRTYKWFVWQPTDPVVSQLFNIAQSGAVQWLFATLGGLVYAWDSTQLQDRNGNTPTQYPVTIRTSWQDFNDPTMRKAINDITVLTDDNPNLQVTVEGAYSEADFAAPQVVSNARTLVQDPLGEWKLMLAGSISRHRWYRFTFYDPPSTVLNILKGVNAELVPIFRH